MGAAVVGRPDPRLGAVPVAVVELRRGGDSPSRAQLREHAARQLTPCELPVDIYIVDELPRTDSAKVDLTAVILLVNNSALG